MSTHYDVIIALAQAEAPWPISWRRRGGIFFCWNGVVTFGGSKLEVLKYKMVPPSSLVISSGMGAD